MAERLRFRAGPVTIECMTTIERATQHTGNPIEGLTDDEVADLAKRAADGEAEALNRLLGVTH